MKRFAPLQDEPVARQYLELLMPGKVDAIEHDMDPAVVDVDVRDKLVKMADTLPAKTPKSIKVVGAMSHKGEGVSESDITFECEFQSRWYLVNVALQRKGSVTTVLGLGVTPLSDSVENLNRFTLLGKSAVQYLVLALAVSSLLFSFYVLVMCKRTKRGTKRWLWMVLVLVGVGKFAVNWNTGQWTFTILAVQIPSAGATAPFYAPWTIAAYLPLGAIIFLNERWRDKVLGRYDQHPHSPPLIKIE
jgi:hypothetical protein